jgi:hypothetical protein
VLLNILRTKVVYVIEGDSSWIDQPVYLYLPCL